MKDLVKLLAASGKLKFTDIKNKLKIDDPTKLSFHLRILKEHFLIEQDSDKIYMLSSNGKNLLENLKKIDGGGLRKCAARPKNLLEGLVCQVNVCSITVFTYPP